MNKLSEFFKKSVILHSTIKGGSLGLIIWFLHTIVYRVIGLKPLFYYNIAEFITGGIIIGAVIGLAVSTMRQK